MQISRKASASQSMSSKANSGLSMISRACGVGLSLLLILCVMTSTAHANTPGKHSVALSWLESDPTAVSYNIYKGTVTGICSGTVVPYVAFWPTKTYLDVNVAAGQTPIYAISAVNGAGGESNCTPELQVTVPPSPSTPTGLQGTAN